MTKAEMASLLERITKELQQVREDGQKEYAHDEGNAFRNFESLADDLSITREKVLWIFLKKHLDGILAHINGHTSQREPITGRIKDAMMYLALLWGMVEEMAEKKPQIICGCRWAPGEAVCALAPGHLYKHMDIKGGRWD